MILLLKLILVILSVMLEMEDWEIIKLLLHIYQMKVELIILIFIFWNGVKMFF